MTLNDKMKSEFGGLESLNLKLTELCFLKAFSLSLPLSFSKNEFLETRCSPVYCGLLSLELEA